MAEFQTILGIILIITAVVIMAIAIYNMVVIGKATINTNDIKSTITDGERNGAIATNVFLILIGVVLGVYGIIILLPTDKITAGVPSLRASRALSGSVLTPAGSYM